MARVGILGGTFNPPHIGHGVCAQEAVIQLGLDRLLLMPAARPPHKTLDDPGREHRLAMCAGAAEEGERIEPSRMELDRPGPSYAVDTLSALHEIAPDDELTFVVGADMALTLPGWREPERILELAGLAVADRGGTERDAVVEAVEGLAGAPGRVAFFAMPRVDISSTFVRRRAAAGDPIGHLVPGPVARYIERHHLYAAGGSRAPATG